MSYKSELIEQSEALGVEIDKRWGVDRIRQALDMDSGENVAAHTDANIEYMNDRVKAIWAGQSRDLPIHERKSRIMSALKEKGLPVEDIQWPV